MKYILSFSFIILFAVNSYAITNLSKGGSNSTSQGSYSTIKNRAQVNDRINSIDTELKKYNSPNDNYYKQNDLRKEKENLIDKR